MTAARTFDENPFADRPILARSTLLTRMALQGGCQGDRRENGQAGEQESGDGKATNEGANARLGRSRERGSEGTFGGLSHTAVL